MKHLGTILMFVVVYAIATVVGKSCGSTAAKKQLKKQSGSKRESSKVDQSLLTFQEELKRTERLLEAYHKSIGKPLVSIKTLSAYNKKMSQIETSGLPGNILRSFGQYKRTHESLLSHLNNTPFPTELISGGADAVGDWIIQQREKDPTFLQRYSNEMNEWENKSAKFQKKVQDTTYDFSMALMDHGLKYNFMAGAEWLKDKL